MGIFIDNMGIRETRVYKMGMEYTRYMRLPAGLKVLASELPTLGKKYTVK
jgi:hypothetical protein